MSLLGWRCCTCERRGSSGGINDFSDCLRLETDLLAGLRDALNARTSHDACVLLFGDDVYVGPILNLGPIEGRGSACGKMPLLRSNDEVKQHWNKSEGMIETR